MATLTTLALKSKPRSAIERLARVEAGRFGD